jgi:16S rRNA (cytosine967-C5)-methyltransferase
VLVASTDSNPVAVWNHPLWWIERLKTERPHDWQEILTASNNHAPMTLRLNVQKARGIDYLESLQRDGISADLGANGQIYLAKALPVQRVPGFQSGQVSVQDAAAQRAAPLLLGSWEGRTNLRILDACAAPGGKTGHLLEISHASVTALEVDAHRSKRITENLQRLGLFAEVKVGDASNPAGWWDGELFDAILLDAPCTASGIVRRHPDVRWLRREADIGQLALLQRKLLNTLWPLVKPGGRLLYCTCSVFAAEGVQQIETFLEHNTDTRLLPSPGHLLPRSGYKDGMPADNPMLDHDGFYYALLQKILP